MSKAKEQSSLLNDDPKLEAFYGVPKEVQFCTRCVISNQRPSSVVERKNKGEKNKEDFIFFDEEGVCSACRYHDLKHNVIDWEEREENLIDLCNRFRSKEGNYDCIVPGSGGKDSAFTSHILKAKYNMNPLTVTWAPHKYTQIGHLNFENWCHSGFNNIVFTPNGELHRLLTKNAFINLCHPFQPFIIGQRQIGPQLASKFKIPLIFYGENGAEYGNPIEQGSDSQMMTKFYTGDPKEDLIIGGESLEKTIKDGDFHTSDTLPYKPISEEEALNLGIEVHYLSYYLKWDPQENYYYAVENTGFQPNERRTEGSFSKYSSIDDKIDPLHYYTTLAKFGLGRSSYDAAQEIRCGKLDREEGVMLVNKFDNEFPSLFLQEMLEYMDITEDIFTEVIDNARSPHLWKFQDDKWVLRNILE
mgnify:CR=1 FL=1|tara:strand:- start:636 stop:1883 length:1248 start_codon:yes stop_codon:yes gene_type:complete